MIPALVYAPFNFIAPPSWRAIVKLTSLKHRVPVKDILSKSRLRPIVAARHEAIQLVYDHCGRGCDWVGDRFGRDHTVVLYAVRKRKGLPMRAGRVPTTAKGRDWPVVN